MRSSRTIIACSALLLNFVVACDKPTAPSTNTTTETSAPEGMPNVVERLQAGGTHWSSHEELNLAGLKLKAGSDYYIWPAEDAVYSPSNDGVTIRLHWRRRPEGKAVTGGTVYGSLRSEWPGAKQNLRIAMNNFDGLPERGLLEIPFAPWRAKGEGDIAVFLNRPGDPGALSNVLRLKVAAN